MKSRAKAFVLTAVHELRSFIRKPALRQGGLVVLDQSFLSLATFATGVMLARATNKDQYSMYVLGLSLVLFLQGFHRALVNAPFTIYAPGLTETNREIYQGSTFVHTLALSAGAAAGLVGMQVATDTSLVTASADRLVTVLPVLAGVTISFFLRDFIRNVLLATLQITTGVIANVLSTIAQLVLTAWLFASYRLTVQNAFEVTALTSLAAAAYMLWIYRGSMRVVPTRIWPDFLQSLKTGKWILIDVFAYLGASQAYPWLLLYLLDTRSVAVFGVCSSLAGLAAPFLRGANAYIHPRMVHGYRAGGGRRLAHLVKLSVVLLSIPYCAWLAIAGYFANELLELIYGRGYSGYAVLAILLLLRGAIEGASSPVSAALQTAERADVVTVSLVFGAIITLASGLLLIGNLGLNGAGAAAAASSAVSAWWRWIKLRRILRYEVRSDG